MTALTTDLVRPKRRLGMTASRVGMTDTQKYWFKILLARGNELHTGDCKGGDTDGFHIAIGEGLSTVAHPCNLRSQRAFNPHGFTHQELHPLDRNKNIVDWSEEMIACPNGDEEMLRSGTWATVRYARKVGKPLYVIGPHGAIVLTNMTEESQAWFGRTFYEKLQGQPRRSARID